MTIRFLPATLSIAALLSFGLSTDALAAKAGKAKKGAGKVRNSLAQFDKNRDGTIDTTESEALRTSYGAMAALDVDHDGKLSDSEIAAAKVGKGGKGGKKKAGKNPNGAKKGKGAKKKKQA